jgi:hypothetical protein
MIRRAFLLVLLVAFFRLSNAHASGPGVRQAPDEAPRAVVSRFSQGWVQDDARRLSFRPAETRIAGKVQYTFRF